MAEHVCPSCGRGNLNRSARRGPWEKFVLPRFGVFPWRCGRCQTRYRLSDRGSHVERLRTELEGMPDKSTPYEFPRRPA